MDTLPSSLFLRVFAQIEGDLRDSGTFERVNKKFYRLVMTFRKRFVDIEYENVTRRVQLYFFNRKYYLSLRQPHTGPVVHTADSTSINFSSCRQNLHNITTIWWKVAVDSKSLLVDTSDITFSKSLGSWGQAGGERVTFGMAYCCDATFNGRANIDLRDTDFTVVSNFSHGGYCSGGSFEKTNHDQVVIMNGGGYCGWICSDLCEGCEGKAKTGGWYIQLGLLK
jgi:hypothetical protein